MLRTTTRTTMVLAALIVALASFALSPALAQARKDDRSQRKDEKDKKPTAEGLTAAQRQEAAPLAKLADEVMKGTAAGAYLVVPPKDPAKGDGKEPAATQPAPSEVPLTWRNDFLKAQQGQIFVPFAVQLDPGRLGPGTSVAAYLRIAPKGATGLPAPAAGATPPAYPFEDVYFTELRSTGTGLPLRLTRAFAAAPGTYDVYFAIRERPAAATPPDAPVKVALLKQELVIPNYHADELQTSSVLVADKIEQLTAPVTPEAMKERPYVLGDSEITPAADMKFKKTEELQLVFQIYGAKLGTEDKKPDVTVDYVFYQKDATGEKPFNRTPAQRLWQETLPKNFDPDAGHQLMTGQGVPLASFPEGDFRLEIKVTDAKAQKSVTRDVLFTVVAAS